MPSERLRIVIAGGGTGGHLFPGIAVAREWLSREPATITFAGTAHGIEARVIPREGFELDVIRSRGLKGKGLMDGVRGAALVPLGLLDAWSIISRRRPDFVLGVGGYSSGPVVAVASLRGVPTMLHEQNAVPGLTNRLLARFVRAAAITFETTRGFFGEKAFVSGNPVRPEFLSAQPVNDSGSGMHDSGPRVLIVGGSQGAHGINLAMVEAATKLATDGVRIRFTHQTGERDLGLVRDAYRAAGIQAEVEPFLYDMGRRIAEADVVVSRAGSTTLAELAAAGKAAILIPLPTATDDHQRKNAETVEAAGGATVLPQSQATGAVLAARIVSLVDDRTLRDRMSRAMKSLAKPDAAKVIVDRALALIGDGRRNDSGTRGSGARG
jgi:UDP-N-acetylglucosamine--N-acetylmuramyl-(pentapeptide) pyrophosphoryl-undecaprenol N-acetylglucosamine transferase